MFGTEHWRCLAFSSSEQWENCMPAGTPGAYECDFGMMNVTCQQYRLAFWCSNQRTHKWHFPISKSERGRRIVTVVMFDVCSEDKNT